MTIIRSLIFASVFLTGCVAADAPATIDPASAAAELMEVDRAAGAAAPSTDLVAAISAQFAPDVVAPVPGEGFVSGAANVVAVMERDPANRASRASWAPIRVGVSADGQHGFTFGYMTVDRPDSTRAAAKYLAYWVRGADGWRIAAYKRARMDATDPDTTPMDPALPAAGVAISTDSASLAEHAASLRAAEQAFSDEAQTIGLGPAFARHGSEDAINMGPPDGGFLVGASAIGAAIGAGDTGPSPVSWNAERALVASSGDLGITFGHIRPNDEAAGLPRMPFFTIWRRPTPEAEWRYVAE